MSLEEVFERKFLDKIPIWNKALADFLNPIAPLINLLLLITAAICIWAVFWKRPQYKLLWLAYLWSP